MNKRLAAWTAAVTAGSACLVLSAAAGAATSQWSGTMPNGGCSAAQPVPVSGASRIEVSAAVRDSESGQYQPVIVDSSGRPVSSNGSYDTPGGGAYAVKLCHTGDSADPPVMHFTALIGTGPAGQPALPRFSGGVAGAFTTLQPAVKLFRSASGTGAIRTTGGLAWVSVHVNNAGRANVRVDAKSRGLHLAYARGFKVSFGTNRVLIVGHALRILLVKSSGSERLSITAPRLATNGRVVRGGFVIA